MAALRVAAAAVFWPAGGGAWCKALTTQNRCVSSSASLPMMSATLLRSSLGLKMARFTNELL